MSFPPEPAALPERFTRKQAPPSQLGRLEARIMTVLWKCGEVSVLEVANRLRPARAYTTVMTTLDRLYKRGLLERQKAKRAYRYRPRFSQPEWFRLQAGEMVEQYLASHASGEILLSCLVDVLGQRDAALLEKLERQIQARRRARQDPAS